MIIKKLSIFFICLFVCFGVNAKQCKKGQPCGNSCISWSKTCRINSYSSNYDYKSKKAPNATSQYVYPAIYVVTATKLNVRDNPFTTQEIVGYLEKGQEILVERIIFDWAMITYNEKNYWVSTKYISFLRK
ncbi:SH3 domain-containing protein [Vibrio cholerae]|uniref:SH3 domain-containing protein n=1 Tax=Vibrio cholerae TaxID=666 RepID=UPI0015813E4F|nr:SH3 domain-containing protein [Vibrio cholerae]EGQ9578027.1 SH3 domain-containing protein [Vibrio cholerae]ELR6564674.1 SH3 domain-containing protein [Vibrio cholerae]QKU98766.1 SH3 domain-containing protein [Vibrio cholerae]